MHKVGTYVVYENRGICVVDEITKLNLPGAKKGQKYYELKPVFEDGGKIFSAVDNDKVLLREMVEKEEAEKFLQTMKEIEPLLVDYEKERESVYKKAVQSGDLHNLASLLRTLYSRRKERLEQGKKTTNMDDRFYKKAMANLCGELAVSLEVEKVEIENRVKDMLEEME